MEKVRKGKGIPEKYVDHIREHGIPEWFIESCNKIQYMFPKAHAAAYVTMALRIAWFKVYKPHQYYATYFTVRADEFEVGVANMTVDQIRQALKELHELPSLSAKEKAKVIMLEMVLEMKMRKIEFCNIDIYKSEAMNFTVTEDNFIRPPLNAVPGLGETAAISIVDARKEEPFKSQDDLLLRTKLSSTLLQSLDAAGCLKDLPKSQQISLFDF
jgi:DNA polymerase-3 subunit alpha (Gram-positive type)